MLYLKVVSEREKGVAKLKDYVYKIFTLKSNLLEDCWRQELPRQVQAMNKVWVRMKSDCLPVMVIWRFEKKKKEKKKDPFLTKWLGFTEKH